jgi:hypothetical protein
MMKIGLYNLEPKINNTAMMQVSYYHKGHGDEVELYNHFEHDKYDKIYAFSLFDFTDKGYVTTDMIKGGTGFDIKSRLPRAIENSNLDYSIFPDCQTSYIWFSRGCIRACPFCVVNEKEGQIHSVEPKNLNPNGEWITVMDNNFFANPKWEKSIQQLTRWDQPVDLQGFDVRIFKPEHGEALNKLRIHKQLKFAWDNPNEDLTGKIKELLGYVRPYKLMCYVLIGFDSTIREDQERVETLRTMKIDPFVMPYDRTDEYQRAYARYVNHKAVFKTVSFRDYCTTKGVLV